jgi:pimeloyl-ACP methyl ester carboxylesterase
MATLEPTYPENLYKSAEGYAQIMQWYESAIVRLPFPVESHFVETRYGQTHMLTCGDPAAPPLLLVQGYGASAPLWHKQLADFAQHYRVVALDIVGQPGKSAPTLPGLFGDGYAQWMVDVLDALEIEQADVAGVCLGGWIVMKLAAYAPERLKRAVMLSPVGIASFKIYVRSGIPLVLNLGRDMDAAGLRLLRMTFTPPGSGLQFDRELARAFVPVLRHYRVGVVAGIGSGTPSPRELWAGTRALVKFVRGEPASTLRKIAVPTLLLVGEHEAIYNPRAAVRRAQRHIPNVIAEIIEGTGHATIYDRPDVVNPRILHFLKEGV